MIMKTLVFPAMLYWFEAWDLKKANINREREGPI